MELNVQDTNVEEGDATLERSDTVSAIVKGALVEELNKERVMVAHPREVL